jgi:hypothetical protein
MRGIQRWNSCSATGDKQDGFEKLYVEMQRTTVIQRSDENMGPPFSGNGGVADETNKQSGRKPSFVDLSLNAYPNAKIPRHVIPAMSAPSSLPRISFVGKVSKTKRYSKLITLELGDN